MWHLFLHWPVPAGGEAGREALPPSAAAVFARLAYREGGEDRGNAKPAPVKAV